MQASVFTPLFLVLLFLSFSCGIQDDLNPCTKWPKKQWQIITERRFTCSGNITHVITCNHETNPKMRVIIFNKNLIHTGSSSTTVTVDGGQLIRFGRPASYNEGDYLEYVVEYDGPSPTVVECYLEIFVIDGSPEGSKKDVQETICANVTKFAAALLATKACFDDVEINSDNINEPTCKLHGQSDIANIGSTVCIIILVILLVILIISCLIVWAVGVRQGRVAVEVTFGRKHYCSNSKTDHHVNTNLSSSTAAPAGSQFNIQTVYSTVAEASAEYEDSSLLLLSQREAPFREPQGTLEGVCNQISEENYMHIPLDSITTGCLLGEGQFGVVHKGEWKHNSSKYTVAVKVMRDDATEEEKVKLLCEAATMGQFDHPNIIKLYGVVTAINSPMMVMEYLQTGDLRNYLLKIKENIDHIFPTKLLQFCQEITESMIYLSSKRFIHRDLAARNILLDEHLHCKVADFGMSHDMDKDYYYKPKGGQIPLKWTAPEALLHHKFSTKSDVWSFGMVMFEIWSLGHKPFEDMNTDEIISVLDTGYCQPPPSGCPKKIYEIMVLCWNPDSHRRPPISDISKLLSGDINDILQTSLETGVLGQSLLDSKELYSELQYMYCQ